MGRVEAPARERREVWKRVGDSSSSDTFKGELGSPAHNKWLQAQADKNHERTKPGSPLHTEVKTKAEKLFGPGTKLVRRVANYWELRSADGERLTANERNRYYTMDDIKKALDKPKDSTIFSPHGRVTMEKHSGVISKF